MRRLSFLALALALGFSVAHAGDTTSDKVPDVIGLAEKDNQVMEHLDYLTNKIGPRLTGSSNIARAYEWAKGKFEEFGLKNVHTETWGEYPIVFDRGKMSGKVITEDGEKNLFFGSMAWTAGTKGPVRGRAMWAPRTMEELDKVKDQLKGAWLIVRSTGGGRRGGGEGGGRRGGQSNPDRDALRKALDEAGIAGMVRGASSELVITDGRPNGITMDKLPTRVSVTITKDDYTAIAAKLEKDQKVELELDVQNKFSAGPAQHKNVIGEIPGTDKADEVVIVGGHLDSWDGATGATDNGTGVATTMEAARLLCKAGARPRRTIRFILWSGEEQGLLGSAAYCKKHKDELAKVSCILIHDGGTNYVSGIQVTKAMAPLLEPALAHLNFDEKMPFKVRTVTHLPFGVGSDHDSFLANGVPGFFWNQTGRQNYDHEHHTQFDTFEAAIPEYQKHSAVVIAMGSLAVANLDVLLPRQDMLAPNAGFGRGGPRKMLGVSCDEELVIQSIVEGSLAEKAGLKEGDRLLSIGDTKITSVEELREAVIAAEGKVKVRYVREGKELEVEVTFITPEKKKRWL
jgi:hypothetical protein